MYERKEGYDICENAENIIDLWNITDAQRDGRPAYYTGEVAPSVQRRSLADAHY